MLPPKPTKFNDLYVVTDYMDSDLHDVIRCNPDISAAHIKFFAYQLLKGLKYIHSAGVIHRDIKPGNLLVNKKSMLKICDFGLATVQNEKINKDYSLTNYVVTRWFRAPELILRYEAKNYSSKIDMWSAGLVLGELFRKKVVFGEKNMEKQLTAILSLLGQPPASVMEQIKDKKVLAFIDEKVSTVKRVSFEEKFPKADEQAIDLLKGLLTFDTK